jgi:hypothetical protein
MPMDRVQDVAPRAAVPATQATTRLTRARGPWLRVARQPGPPGRSRTSLWCRPYRVAVGATRASIRIAARAPRHQVVRRAMEHPHRHHRQARGEVGCGLSLASSGNCASSAAPTAGLRTSRPGAGTGNSTPARFAAKRAGFSAATIHAPCPPMDRPVSTAAPGHRGTRAGGVERGDRHA